MRALARAQSLDSQPVCAALDRWLARHQGMQCIAAFAALPGEVDLSTWIVRHPDRCWVYPRVVGSSLTFHAVTHPPTELFPGAFHVREPSPDLPEIPVERIDAFLCPGLAFDPHGGRLGRGRGFYDRILACAKPTAVKTGVCFPWQIVPNTYQEPHDVRMDGVVSA